MAFVLVASEMEMHISFRIENGPDCLVKYALNCHLYMRPLLAYLRVMPNPNKYVNTEDDVYKFSSTDENEAGWSGNFM